MGPHNRMGNSLKRAHVYLVGAGPGDPKLLTLRGKECLELADVVLYDHLANPELLRHVPVDAERIYVGRKGRGIVSGTKKKSTRCWSIRLRKENVSCDSRAVIPSCSVVVVRGGRNDC